jgi:hypothetical protein
MLQDESLRDELAGTTAVAIILKENKLYCVCAPVTVCNYKQLVNRLMMYGSQKVSGKLRQAVLGPCREAP